MISNCAWHVTRVTRDTRHKQGVKWEHPMSMKPTTFSCSIFVNFPMNPLPPWRLEPQHWVARLCWSQVPSPGLGAKLVSKQVTELWGLGRIRHRDIDNTTQTRNGPCMLAVLTLNGFHIQDHAMGFDDQQDYHQQPANLCTKQSFIHYLNVLFLGPLSRVFNANYCPRFL